MKLNSITRWGGRGGETGNNYKPTGGLGFRADNTLKYSCLPNLETGSESVSSTDRQHHSLWWAATGLPCGGQQLQWMRELLAPPQTPVSRLTHSRGTHTEGGREGECERFTTPTLFISFSSSNSEAWPFRAGYEGFGLCKIHSIMITPCHHLPGPWAHIYVCVCVRWHHVVDAPAGFNWLYGFGWETLRSWCDRSQVS